MVKRKNNQKNKYKKLIFVLKFLGVSFCLLIFVFSALFIYYIKDLPRPEKFLEKPFILSTKIYDRTGKILLYEIYGDEIRIIISLDEVPQHLVYAILAAEDNRFFKHPGIDYRGIVRAMWFNFKEGRTVKGGSTLTQQLSRTAFLDRERVLGRKIREIVLTLELERRYSKDQILEWYLNHIPLGIAYGVGAASEIFFNKHISELSLAESVILATLIRSPSRLSPFGPNKNELFIIKDAVLDEMVREGFITKKEAEEAKIEEVIFTTGHKQRLKAPHFTLNIKQYLINIYGKDFLKEKGLTIITSLDWELQQLAEQIVKQKIKINKTYHNAHNIAMIALDPTNGHILALVGSVDWFKNPYPKECQPGINCLIDPKFNAALHTGRQPGSAFKPFIFATAFENNLEINTETIIIDKITNFGIWGGVPFIPQNFDLKTRGEVTLKQILAQSLNIPTVKVLRDLIGLGNFSIGIEKSINLSKNLGINNLQPPSLYGPSFSLGVSDVNLIDMVSAYGVFAFEGYKVQPVSILNIKNAQGIIIKENKKTPKKALSNRTSQFINNILSDKKARAPIFGKMLNLNSKNQNYNVAVKTGTTDEFRDGWTIGYTFNNTFNNTPLVVGVWAGNSDNSPTKSPGLILTTPTWKAFIEEVLF